MRTLPIHVLLMVMASAGCSPEDAASDGTGTPSGGSSGSAGNGANGGSSGSSGSSGGSGSGGSAGTSHHHGSGGAAGSADACPTETSFPIIPSEFDVDSELVPAWGSGNIPESAAPDVVGAFRFLCRPSHLSYDDPIVYPCQPGKAHLHQFFGNTLADAYSNYESLRTTGMSTCVSPLNRSAYWIPAMMNGKGKVVRPEYITIYYKRLPKDSPTCQQQGKECVPIPRGLRFVFGYDAAKPNDKSGHGYFNCDGPTATPGSYPDIPTAAKNCPAGNLFGAVISAPPCWNGTDLDSPDHRSHLAHGSYGDWGYYKCPDTHPYIIPTFTLGAWYKVGSDLASSWHLSSDMHPDGSMMTPGSTFHADWMGAWDDSVMQMWTDHCIDKLLNCSGGDLGNGKQLKAYPGFDDVPDDNLVDPPPK